ncbi:hypothetical protein CRYUN_Cryun19dG0069700 [Craigia yunnanensis]
MDGEISEEMEEFFSIEESNEVEKCFDIKYEFGAPQWYDFNRPETDWEAKEAQLWFESAESYPPSPFVIKLNWRYDINGDGEFVNASIDCDEYEKGNIQTGQILSDRDSKKAIYLYEYVMAKSILQLKQCFGL